MTPGNKYDGSTENTSPNVAAYKESGKARIGDVNENEVNMKLAGADGQHKGVSPSALRSFGVQHNTHKVSSEI